MKKWCFVLALLLMVVLTVGTIPANAGTFNTFDYTFNSEGVTATGTLSGDLIAPGEYLLTSGTIYLTGAPRDLNGNGALAPNPPYAFEIGGGTTLNGLDDLLFPDADPQIDTEGGLAFLMHSGLGVGIGGNSPGSYWMFGGNWELNTNGSFSATPSPVPEPATLGLLGTGLIGLGLVIKRKRTRANS